MAAVRCNCVRPVRKPAALLWPLADAPACLAAFQPLADLTAEVQQTQLDSMRSTINLRLVPLRGVADGVVTAGLRQLQASAPEVYAAVAAAYGTDGSQPMQVAEAS